MEKNRVRMKYIYPTRMRQYQSFFFFFCFFFFLSFLYLVDWLMMKVKKAHFFETGAY
jgi:hypothetical protein